MSITDNETAEDHPQRRYLRSARDLAVDELPVLPGVVVRLMGLTAESEKFFEEVLTVASEDPGLALRVIRTANSPMSAPRSPITTLEAAVARLGANHIADLVTTVAITRVFVPRTPGETELWLHAIEVATACRALVERLHLDGVAPEHAYLAGLLHDIGRFILFDQAPDFIQAVDDLAWTTPEELIRAEQQICGIDHAKLGGRVCAHWDVPEPILTIVKNHHQPITDFPHPASALLATVKAADWLSIWHRTHDDTNDLANATQRDVPELELLSTHNLPGTITTELANLLPTVRAASNQAAQHLGLRTH